MRLFAADVVEFAVVFAQLFEAIEAGTTLSSKQCDEILAICKEIYG